MSKQVRFTDSDTIIDFEHDSSNEDFLVDLINNYIRYYQYISKTNKGLFDDIDSSSDKTITNRQLELFYKELKLYKKKADIEVLEYNDFTKDYPYKIFKDDTPIYVSKSLFALLIEITNLEHENPKLNYFIKN